MQRQALVRRGPHPLQCQPVGLEMQGFKGIPIHILFASLVDNSHLYNTSCIHSGLPTCMFAHRVGHLQNCLHGRVVSVHSVAIQIVMEM